MTDTHQQLPRRTVLAAGAAGAAGATLAFFGVGRPRGGYDGRNRL